MGSKIVLTTSKLDSTRSINEQDKFLNHICSNEHKEYLPLIVGTILVQVLQFVESNVLNTVLDAAFNVDVAAVILNNMRILWLKIISLRSHNVNLIASGEVCGWTSDGLADLLL